MKKRKINLTGQILIALVLGAIVGIVLYGMSDSYVKDTLLVDGIFKFLGTVFIAALKMLIVPVVFFALIVGVSSLNDIRQLGRIGTKTMLYYLITTALAITLALGVAFVMSPGSNFKMPVLEETDVAINEGMPFIDVLINIVPSNPVQAMAEANMLQIIFFAIMVGIAITIMGDKVPTVRLFVNECNDLFLRLVTVVMLFAPLGIFGLTARTFSQLGYEIMLPLSKYLLTVVIGLALQVVVYMIILRVVSGLNPIYLVKKITSPLSIAFSTASSAAALPVTIRTAEEQLGVDKKVASFTLPLGATINMDGTAIMQGVATFFIAQVYADGLSPSQFLLVILTATLASIGTASVPGAGLIMLSMVLTTVGLPIEGIALIIAVDRIIDMARTSINVCGDIVGTVVVAKSENALDKEIYYTTK